MRYKFTVLGVCLLAAAVQCKAQGDAASKDKGQPAEVASEEPSSAPVPRPTIEAVAEVPALFPRLVAGMKLEESVNAYVEVLAVLEATKPDPEVKTMKTAVMAAYLFKMWSADARKLADKLAQTVAPELLAPIVAASAVIMGNQAPMITDVFVGRVPEAYAQTIRNAGAHPETVLPPGLLVNIGLPVPHSVPPTGREPTALPLAPPLRPEGERPSVSVPPVRRPPPDPPPPPPIPPTYTGQ